MIMSCKYNIEFWERGPPDRIDTHQAHVVAEMTVSEEFKFFTEDTILRDRKSGTVKNLFSMMTLRPENVSTSYLVTKTDFTWYKWNVT